MQAHLPIRSGGPVRVVLALTFLAAAALLLPAARAEASSRLGGVPPAGVDAASLLPAHPLDARFEQHSRRGGGGSGGGGGQAVPRGGSGGGSGSSGGSSGGSGGGRSGGSSGGSGSSGGTTTGSPRTRSGSGSDGSSGTAGSRPRDGRPVQGTAVERRDDGDGRRDGGDRTVIVGGGYYGGYYPWGWGGLGLGGYYGYYDPWGWGYDPYVPSRGYWSGPDGSLRLKVSPRQAEVYVDGYYAGSVDDYDGAFQRLHLEPGPHRIEVRLDGYEPLAFEVRIPPGRTVTYKGTLERDGEATDADDRR